MQILVEPTKNGVRAQTGMPWNISVEGETEQETLDAISRIIIERQRDGTKVVEFTPPLSAEENPWLKVAGIFQDDPTFDDWQEAIQEYRRERHAEIEAEGS